jgi:shikimate kinase
MQPLESSNIFLCGFMGAGKSAVCKRLALKLGWAFVDIDREVERLENKKIFDIFTLRGEEYFRAREEEMIDWVTRSERRVISLGGGALLSEKNRVKISDSGILVWLSASPKVLLERLARSYQRPLLKPEWLDGNGQPSSIFLEFLAEREKEYKKALFNISTDGRTADQAAEEVFARLKQAKYVA